MRFTTIGVLRTLPWLEIALMLMAVVSGSVRAEGEVDYTFKYGGRLYVPVAYAAPSQSTCVTGDIAIQADGKILVVGSCALSFLATGNVQVTYSALGTVMRLNADGTLDSTFGNKPWPSPATYPAIPGFQFFANQPDIITESNSIAIRADGRIVVAGTLAGRTFQPGTSTGLLSVAIVQLMTDGSFDSSFGTNGISVQYLGDATHDDNVLRRIVLDTGGNIVVAGSHTLNSAQSNHDADFLYGRIAVDGKSAQLFAVPFDLGGDNQDFANDIAIDAQGRYVIGGSARSSTDGFDCAMIRVAPSTLQLDATFGTQGKALVEFNVNGTSNDDHCTSVAVQTDGGILIAGSAANASQSTDAVVARMTSAGMLDPAFGRRDLSTSISGALDAVNRILVQPWDGKIVLVGSATSSNFVLGEDFAAIRLNSSGSIDTSFTATTPDSIRGVVQVDFGFDGPNAYSSESAISAAFSGHNLVIAGTQLSSKAADADPTPQFAVTRLSYDDIFRFGFDPLPVTPTCRNGSSTLQQAMSQLVQATNGLKVCIAPISTPLGSSGATGTACASSTCSSGATGCAAVVHTQAGTAAFVVDSQSINVSAVPAQIDPVNIPATLNIPFVGQINCTLTASATTFDVNGTLSLASDHQFGGYVTSATADVESFNTQLSGCAPYTPLIEFFAPQMEQLLIPEINANLATAIPAAIQQDICLE